ncbi:MAG: hypothetical protein CL916_13325 [Deltaproteobacteria bacterium]|nr:hypothetical protein [Deltaproteobacteria bacterium]
MCFLGRNGEEYEWNAKQFAIDYLTINKSHIGDTLDIGNLLWMFGHEDHRYRDLADLLLFPGEGDSPFFSQLTLEVYTNLLENKHSFTKAKEKILREEWSDRETNKIDVQWFVDRFESEGPTGFLLEFAFQKSDLEGWNQGALAITRSAKIENSQVLRFALDTLNTKHDGTSFLSTFVQSEEGVAYIRRILLHKIRVCVQQAISWVEEEKLIKSLGVEFLKELCHGKDTLSVSSIRPFVGEEPLPEKELEDIAIRLITPKAQSWLTESNEYTYEEIGWEYIDTYTQNFGLNKELSTEKKPVLRYKFLRTFMERKVPLTFGEVDVQGAILDRLYNAMNFDSPRNQFYLKLLRSRHDVANKGVPESLAFKKEDFSFEKFVQWAKSKKPAIRDFTCFVSTYQMSYWVKQGLGFADFTSTLELPYLDIQDHMRNAFFEKNDHSYITVDKSNKNFTVNGLFSYCFNKNSFVQKLGLELLNTHPTKFGDPEQLFLLADSKNPVVRELVIQTLWKNHRNTALRDKWFPYPDSVAPISIASEPGTVLSPARHLTDPNNISGLNPEDVKGTHKYLGPIYTASKDLKDEYKEGARKFFRTMLFSLPSYPGTEPAALKNSSWRNKTTLIHAMRDVALKDEDFAEVIVPIIRNFQSIKAKKLKEACISTLVRLEACYPNNNNLTYPYTQGGE